MTLFDLVNHLRINILDDHGGVGVDWSAYAQEDYGSLQLRWTNEELVRNINEALFQVYRRINPVSDTYDLEIAAGEITYKLPSYITKVLFVKDSKDQRIEERSFEDLWYMRRSNNRPKYFSTDYTTGKFLIGPTPLADDILSLIVYRLPLEKLTWDFPENELELRDEISIPMLDYAAYLCYTKDEANILDPRRAETFAARFDREFPFTSAYSNARKLRTSNRPIRYGGM